MSESNRLDAPSRATPETHQRGRDKVARIPVKVVPAEQPLRKPSWIRAKAPVGPGVTRIKRLLREAKLATVCEEAMCPNLGECFSHGTATFMILGDVCTRRCPFCDVAHGKPEPLDSEEPEHLARNPWISLAYIADKEKPVYIDGAAAYGGVGLDMSLRPDDVEAIEVHSTASAPVEFSRNACGVVLVWTRLPEPTERRGSWWKGLAVAGGFLAVMVVTR